MNTPYIGYECISLSILQHHSDDGAV